MSDCVILSLFLVVAVTTPNTCHSDYYSSFVVLLASPYLELILCRRRKLLHSVACPCGLAYLFPFAFYVLINAVICTAYLRPRKLNAVSANTAYL